MRLVIDLQAAQSMSAKRGIGRYSLELALAMMRAPRGHDVIVALNATLDIHTLDLYDTLRGVLPRQAIATWHGLTGSSHLLGEPARRAASEIIRAEAMLAHAPDAIHVASMFEGASDDTVTGWPPGVARPAVATTFYDAIPLIRRETYLDSAWAANGLTEWYLGRLDEIRRSDLLLAISQSSAQEAIVHLGMMPDQVANLRAGVSPRFARHAATDMPGFKSRLGLPDEFILFLGAGEPRKNEAGLLRAMALLPAGLRARYRAVIVGRIEPATFAGMLVEARLQPGEAVLIPWVDEADLPALYAAATVFVFPSLHEGFGLPALEAMACGTATLASNTTSLPEVVGDPEALFDPTDPVSISHRIQAVLSDPGLLARLQTDGCARAATFTWEASATRAWDALERLTGRQPKPPGRPRLAFVSPAPPVASGIADYSAELLPALAAHYDITLFCANPEAVAAPLGGAIALAAENTLPERAREFDRVLYQIGNSEFHAVALDTLLPEVPGVVMQHDAFLSGAMTIRSRDHPGGIPPLLFEAEGWPGLQILARDGLDKVLRDLPCSMPMLSDALGVMVHSLHAAGIQRDVAGPTLRLLDVLPLLRAIPELPTREAARQALGIAPDALVVTSFGMMAVTKCPDLVVAGFAAAFATRPAAILVFAGAPEPEAGIALRPAEAAGLKGRVRVTGRLSVAAYRRWLAATDIAVQLRRDSRGESSAALTDAMGAGLPIIANAHGALAELPPDALILLQDDADVSSIAAALHHLADAPMVRADLGRRAREHVRSCLSPDILAARYARAIEAGYAPSPRLMLDRALRGAAGTGADTSAVASCLAATFPRQLPRRLLLVAAAQGGALAHLKAAVATTPGGWRVEALREDAGALILDRLAAAAALGLKAVTPDEHFEAGPGDRLIVLSEWRACSAALVRLLRRTRLAGATVILAAEVVDAEWPSWADGIIAPAPQMGGRQRQGASAPVVFAPQPGQSIFALVTEGFL